MQALKQNAYYVRIIIWTRLGLQAKLTAACVPIVRISLVRIRIFDEFFLL